MPLSIAYRAAKVELTRAGEAFLAEARLTVSQAQRTRKLASQLASGSIGEVRVGFTHSAALNPAIPRIFYNFRTENPAINLVLQEMLTARQLECLSRNQLDVGFCRELISIVPPSRVTIERIMQERLIAVLNSQHKLAKQGAVSLKACADEPFVFFLASFLYYRKRLWIYAARQDSNHESFKKQTG
jgi:DNA-binding transcriptional LysR family regulator